MSGQSPTPLKRNTTLQNKVFNVQHGKELLGKQRSRKIQKKSINKSCHKNTGERIKLAGKDVKYALPAQEHRRKHELEMRKKWEVEKMEILEMKNKTSEMKLYLK